MDRKMYKQRIEKIENLLGNEKFLDTYIEEIDKKIQVNDFLSKKIEKRILNKTINKKKYSTFDMLKIACFTLLVVTIWEVGNTSYAREVFSKKANDSIKQENYVSTFSNAFKKFSSSMMSYERKGDK